MSEGMSDADRIRQKRLAKLGGQASTASPHQNTPRDLPQQAPPTHIPVPVINISQNDGNADNNPFSRLGLQSQEKNSKPSPISIKPSSTRPSKREAEGTPRPRSQQAYHDTLEDWEDRTLGSIFRLTLHSERTQDTNGNGLYYLAGVREDLSQASAPLKLNINLLDEALIEAGSAQEQTLDYLLACWKRITRFSRSVKSGTQDGAKTEILKNTKRICMSYCVWAVTMPDMFGKERSQENAFVHHLLVDPESDRGICHDFLAEAVSRFEEDDNIKLMVVEAVAEMGRRASTMSMNDDYRPFVTALSSLVRYSPIVIALAESEQFNPPNVAAQDIEKNTLLGPFFQLSPLQGAVAANYFSSPRTRDRGYIINSQNALRLTLRQHQNELFEIMDRFIKASKESREKTLDWFALIVNTNHKRRAMRTDPRYVSSDGFMINVTVCLDRLCEPFMDASFSKINRIEAEYLRRSPRVNISDETKINADQQTSDKFYDEKLPGTNNFISEIFFLTAAAHHYGTEAAQAKLVDLRKQLKHMDKEIERYEGERAKFTAQGPNVLALFERKLKDFKDQADRGHCVMMATEGVLLDELVQARAMSFMRYAIVWILRLASGVDYPRQSLTLPLPESQPEVFRYLPEYFVEDIVDHFKFVTNHMPQAITPTQCDELVVICITFLRSTEYIKNHGLKSGLVKILFHGVWPVRSFSNGILGNVLNSMPFALEHLLHALMKYYIECEFTGAHGQFYDKFNIRFEIFQVIKCIWGNVVYRNRLLAEANDNVDFFVRYVNLMVNDVTYVLDESFTAFKEISSLTKDLKGESGPLDEATKTQKEEALEAAQGKAKSYMQLTTESLAMLKLFTDALAESFTMPEIVQRLADMLDYNLDALVGPKQNSLRVENKQEYNFDPASLLADIVDVYLNLGSKADFHLAVARDGRSYKPENFAKAARVLSDRAKKSKEELERWSRLCDAIAEAKKSDDEEEEEYGDIPDEFMDPILATLMTDPVILPTSKQVCDRSTIRQMLLSDALDPFNRAPLKIEDVIPDTELKAKIDVFRAEKRGKTAALETDTMDTSEG